MTTVFSSTATVVGDAIPFVTRRLSPRGLMWLRFEFEVSLQRGKLLAGLASWDRCKRAAEHVELPVPVVANGCLLGKERSNYKVGLLSTFRFWSQDLRLASDGDQGGGVKARLKESCKVAFGLGR